MKKVFYVLCALFLICLSGIEIHRLYAKKAGWQEEVLVYTPQTSLCLEVERENQKAERQEKKTAYLTFDDGPSSNTEKNLDTLKKENVVATFFLIGNEITKERESIVKRIVEQGNAVGVHTYCHECENIYCDAAGFFTDYQKASEKIEKVIGKVPVLHRFPWGSNNGYVSSYVDELHEKLHAMGIKSFDWNVSGEDSVAKNVSQETIYENVKKDLCRFDEPIILLHDSESMKNTASVLNRIIAYIRAQGYEFSTLDKREEYLFPESYRK